MADWRVAYARGRQANAARDFPTAITAFNEALEHVQGSDRASVLASRAFAYFDSFQHFEAYLDACAALALEPAHIRGLNARMIVYKESGDLASALTDITALSAALAAQGNPEPELARQKQMMLDKQKSLTQLTPFKEWPTVLVSRHEFAAARIDHLRQWFFAAFQGVAFPREFVKTAADTLLERESSRRGPVRYLDGISKLHVIGNLLGDLSALFKIFEENGYPSSENPYLINGNLTGEAPSVYTVILLVLAKAVDDGAVHFNQGPMDTSKFLRINGFEPQAAGAYEPELAALLVRVLTESPIITVVNRKICVLHGGLPEEVSSLEAVARGSFWGELSTQPGVRRDPGTLYFTFGPDITAAFLAAHGFALLVRSAQPLEHGVSFAHDKRVLTVASRFMGSNGGVATITDAEVSARVLPLAPVVKSEVHHGGEHQHLNGLFARLRREFGRNPAEIGIVRMQTFPNSRGEGEIVPVSTLLGTDVTFGFMSLPIPGSGVAIAMPPFTLTVEAYTIESAALNPGNDHMKTWQLLGTNSGESWDVLDARTDTTDLNGPLFWHTYTVAEPRPYRLVLLKQTERNHRGNWNICLNRLEFFGKIST